MHENVSSGLEDLKNLNLEIHPHLTDFMSSYQFQPDLYQLEDSTASETFQGQPTSVQFQHLFTAM